ncbi:MAG: F0F1 ATP synthase subunit B [Bacteroidaceae bacterium]|nr:F0F1 ATP synthase subunit B [Bacteroidaceae bacterium]
MSLLTPDPGLLFWMFLSFAIVFGLLYKFGFPVIIDSINKRKQFIEQSLLSARQANEKLAGIQAEGQQLLLDAKQQQQQILADALAEKQKIIAAAQQEATDEARRIVKEATQSIENAKQEALTDVHNEVAGLALYIAEQVIREKMKDDKEQQKAVERILNEI